jgi:plasmid maintenance system antidote protein VapI
MKRKLPKQSEIALKIGRTQAYVSMLISGKRRPSLDVALKMEKLYGINPKHWITNRAAVGVTNQRPKREKK